VRLYARADDPPEGRDARVERSDSVRHLRDRDVHGRGGTRLRPPSRMFRRRNDLPRRLHENRAMLAPITRRSLSGSPLGQYCLAIASLIITTPGAPRVMLGEIATVKDGDFEGLKVGPGYGSNRLRRGRVYLRWGGHNVKGQAKAALQRQQQAAAVVVTPGTVLTRWVRRG